MLYAFEYSTCSNVLKMVYNPCILPFQQINIRDNCINDRTQV